MLIEMLQLKKKRYRKLLRLISKLIELRKESVREELIFRNALVTEEKKVENCFFPFSNPI